MSYEKISVNVTDGIATIHLRDPEKLNAMSLQMRREMIAALREMEAGGDVAAIIITGDGEKAFSAGADITEVKTRTPSGELSTEAQLRRELTRLLESVRIPTIAAINGHCLGAGLEMALACTLRIAAEGAKIGLPEINLGVIPGSGGTQRLARVVGLGRAMELVTIGKPISAERAYEIGLVNGVYAKADLIGTAHDYCNVWKKHGPLSLMLARDAVLKSCDVDLQSGLDYENKLFALCLASGERDEGVAAFLEKRPASFRQN